MRTIEVEDLMTAAQVAKLLGTTSVTVTTMVKTGRLQGFQLGTGKGEWRIYASSVEKLMKPVSQQNEACA